MCTDSSTTGAQNLSKHGPLTSLWKGQIRPLIRFSFLLPPSLLPSFVPPFLPPLQRFSPTLEDLQTLYSWPPQLEHNLQEVIPFALYLWPYVTGAILSSLRVLSHTTCEVCLVITSHLAKKGDEAQRG